MNIAQVGLICIACGIVAGCSGAKLSPDHFSEDYGQAPAVPKSGGSGPPEFKTAFELPTENFTIHASLPELFAAYRRKLIDIGHPLPAGLAEQYADKEIGILRQRYSGRDEALRAVLIGRLRAAVVRPGVPSDIDHKGTPYPTDRGAAQVGERRAP